MIGMEGPSAVGEIAAAATSAADDVLRHVDHDGKSAIRKESRPVAPPRACPIAPREAAQTRVAGWTAGRSPANLPAEKAALPDAFPTNDEMSAKKSSEGTIAVRTCLGALAACAAFPRRTAAEAATLRFAFQGDLKSLDPYSLNETFTHGMLGNVYEGLTKRDKELKIVPGLAERWETSRADALALPSAQGRQVPQRRGLHRRRRGVLGRALLQPGLRHQDALPRRHQGREGRRPHGRLHPAAPESDPARRMGHLVHHVEEVGRGEQRRRSRSRRPARR